MPAQVSLDLSSSPVEDQASLPALVQLRNVGKRFGAVQVLRELNLDIYSGEIHALMGENGAGKSTLVKILSGVISQYDGEVFIAGQLQHFNNPREAEAAGIVIMHQELSLVREMSVSENLTLGHEQLRFGLIVDRKAAAAKTRDLLDRFGFRLAPDTLVKTLRVGEQQIIEIVRALSLDTKLLIMDEPTSALSQAETDVLMEIIRDLALEGVAILYISHRMDEVFEIADRITVLRDGDLIGSKMAADIDRSDVIEMMVGRRIEANDIVRTKPALRENVLSVRNLTVDGQHSWGQAVQRHLLQDVSFDLRRREILGIGGLLGAGRTELLETIFGARGGRVSGEIIIEGVLCTLASPEEAVEHGLALITEDRKNTGLLLNFDINDNVALPLLARWSWAGIPSFKRITTETKSKIHQLGIRCSGPEHVVGTLSGGNQQKVVLSKWLATNPRILLLDEPTRGVDIGAKDEIYQLIGQLADQGLSIVIASSEIPELMAVCDRLIVLCEGRKIGELTKKQFSADLIKEMSMQFAE